MGAIEEKVVIQTALVLVGCKNKFCKTRALLNTGSTRTCITEDLAGLS